MELWRAGIPKPHRSDSPPLQQPKLSMATELKLSLKEGDQAPAFTANTNGGGKVSLADFTGKHVILYFYPKDDTPGCTKEA